MFKRIMLFIPNILSEVMDFISETYNQGNSCICPLCGSNEIEENLYNEERKTCKDCYHTFISN